jgi:hypothetical protein
MDRSDHELTIHRIPTNTPQKVITSNRSPRTPRRTLYWRSNREKKPSSYELWTHRSVVNYSLIIGGQQGWWRAPSVIESPSCRVSEKASRWDLMVLELAAEEKVFRGLLYWFHDFREFIDAELGQTDPRGPHNTPGRAYPLGAPWCLVGPRSII